MRSLNMKACAVLMMVVAQAGAIAAEARNPLLRPASAGKADGIGAASVPLNLPPAPNVASSLKTALFDPGMSTIDRVALHLSPLRIVATIGNRAILRGSLGKTGNLALTPGAGTSAQGAAGGPTSADRAEAGGVPPERSVTVVSGQAFQIGDGVWVFPVVAGPSVKLFYQASAKERNSQALVYSSSIEIAGTLPPAQEDGESERGAKKAESK